MATIFKKDDPPTTGTNGQQPQQQATQPQQQQAATGNTVIRDNFTAIPQQPQQYQTRVGGNPNQPQPEGGVLTKDEVDNSTVGEVSNISNGTLRGTGGYDAAMSVKGRSSIEPTQKDFGSKATQQLGVKPGDISGFVAKPELTGINQNGQDGAGQGQQAGNDASGNTSGTNPANNSLEAEEDSFFQRQLDERKKFLESDEEKEKREKREKRERMFANIGGMLDSLHRSMAYSGGWEPMKHPEKSEREKVDDRHRALMDERIKRENEYYNAYDKLLANRYRRKKLEDDKAWHDAQLAATKDYNERRLNILQQNADTAQKNADTKQQGQQATKEHHERADANQAARIQQQGAKAAQSGGSGGSRRGRRSSGRGRTGGQYANGYTQTTEKYDRKGNYQGRTVVTKTPGTGGGSGRRSGGAMSKVKL